MSNEECVRLLYRHFLGREADPDGLKSWTALADKEGNIGGVLEGIIKSPEYAVRTASLEPRKLPDATLSACHRLLGRDLLIVDVGAQKLSSEEHVYAPLVRSGISYRIIGFEPLQHRLDERIKNENDPRLTLLPNFVGDGSERTFYINNVDATSSLLPLNQELNKDFVDLSPLETVRNEKVKTERLDTVLADVAAVDLLKLDIQGFELAALRGADTLLERTNVVHCEVEFTPFYSGASLFSEIELYLRSRGFELVDIVHQSRSAYCVGSSWSGTDRLMWADAVFFSQLKEDPACASGYLVQALMAWFVYKKFGLAKHLFERYDAIAGSSIFGSLADSLGNTKSDRGAQPEIQLNPVSTQSAISSNKIDPFKIEELTPPAMTVEKRIEMAIRCDDMDYVARVPDAGKLQTFADGTRVQIMHNGLRVLAGGYEGEWMARLIELCHGCHEPQEERVFHEVMERIPAQATMIELGGYWSFYSLWFLSEGRDRRSIIVEPDPKHLTVGQSNARLNGVEPIFVQAFVGETESTAVPFQSAVSGEVILPRLTVPALIQRYAIQQLDLLHCDIQGAELEVLRSCEQLFKEQRIQFVFVSTHDFRISGDPLVHQRCLATILNCGGQIIAEHDVHESYSGDGLIVAYFGSEEQKSAPVSISFNRYSESLFRNPLYDLATIAKTIAKTKAQ